MLHTFELQTPCHFSNKCIYFFILFPHGLLRTFVKQYYCNVFYNTVLMLDINTYTLSKYAKVLTTMYTRIVLISNPHGAPEES